MLPTGGGVLHLVNNGSAAHNVSIQPTGRASGDIQPGQSKDLDLTGLADGDRRPRRRGAGPDRLG